jgi:hypothetical protein
MLRVKGYELGFLEDKVKFLRGKSWADICMSEKNSTAFLKMQFDTSGGQHTRTVYLYITVRIVHESEH